MKEEPDFLTIAEILYLHDESLARFGGSAGIRDRGLVESAAGAAQNSFWYGHGGLFEIAAAYAFHIAESQAFIDGNKRTAAASAISFLRKNGLPFPKDDGSVYAAMIEIAEKRLDKSGLAARLRRLVESAT
ncbi:MAG TPA: type II toxin-antitoxin system death-on-curing family toxin [Candidatus Angelobacter sp.]|nr:type II toxin-antitoxin system death-on-curing family toxin [Candidatus Angelobacter sp.]